MAATALMGVEKLKALNNPKKIGMRYAKGSIEYHAALLRMTEKEVQQMASYIRTQGVNSKMMKGGKAHTIDTDAIMPFMERILARNQTYGQCFNGSRWAREGVTLSQWKPYRDEEMQLLFRQAHSHIRQLMRKRRSTAGTGKQWKSFFKYKEEHELETEVEEEGPATASSSKEATVSFDETTTPVHDVTKDSSNYESTEDEQSEDEAGRDDSYEDKPAKDKGKNRPTTTVINPSRHITKTDILVAKVASTKKEYYRCSETYFKLDNPVTAIRRKWKADKNAYIDAEVELRIHMRDSVQRK